MPDGTVVKGAQGNFPFDRNTAVSLRAGLESPAAANIRQYAGLIEFDLFGAPWLKPDPQARLRDMPPEEIASVHAAIPPGVMARQRSSPFYPVRRQGTPLPGPNRPSAAPIAH